MLDAIEFVAWGDCKIEHVLKYFMLSSCGKEIQASNLLWYVKIAIYTSGRLLLVFFLILDFYYVNVFYFFEIRESTA